MASKFIKTEDIPSSIWCKETKKIMLPPKLVDLWISLLDTNNLLEMANQDTGEVVGGVSKEDTDKHLAWRYNGSCARVLLSLLDPNHELSEVSDSYASTFAGNDVFLADLPSGSGAATMSILCTLLELRKKNVLPRHPLNITILAGEISTTAREYFNEQIENLTPHLEEQAIWIKHEIFAWDTLDKVSTADLIQKATLAGDKCTTKLLILSNFSGFLKSSTNWKKAQPQFENIFLHSRALQSTAIWVEPQTKPAHSVLSKLVIWFKDKLKFLLEHNNTITDENCYAKATIQCKQPLKIGLDFPVRLSVIRFNLPPSEADCE